MAHRPVHLAPSLLAADFSRLGDEVAEVESAVEWLHVDVMDGHYVPNLTLGPDTVRSLRPRTRLHLDAHLMVTEPDRFALRFVEAGADSVTFHPEVLDDPVALIDRLHEAGAGAGVAVNPGQSLDDVASLLPHVDLLLVMTVEPGFGGQDFRPEVVPTIAAADAWRRANGGSWRLEVDGGVDTDTVGGCADAGADTFVAGSAIFGRQDRVAAADAIREAAVAARPAEVRG